jgi:hypothetical protein
MTMSPHSSWMNASPHSGSEGMRPVFTCNCANANRGNPLTLPQAVQGAGQLFLMNPRELGGNQGVGNFVPLGGTNLTSLSPAALGCFLAENLLDLAPNQFDSEISLAY